MNIFLQPFLLLIFLSILPVAHAGELGRLFYTPQQRQQLEFQGSLANSTEGPKHNYIVVNGVVQKNGGNRTVWLNGIAQTAERGNNDSPATVPVAVPGKSRTVQLKVGQRLLIDTPAQDEVK